jgi:streptomycin 6-kinase
MMGLQTGESAVSSFDAASVPPRLRKIVAGALPGAQILRVSPLGADGKAGDESSKGTGYGAPLRVDVWHRGLPRALVLHTATANAFGHDRRADRAAATVLAADTFAGLPRHVAVVDSGAFRGEHDCVSLAGTDEFYLLTSHAEGEPYARDLRRIARTGQLTATDIARGELLVEYLTKLHARRPPDGKVAYERFWRDTLGSGEGIFGIADGYPDGVPNAPRARLERIEEECLRWRHRLRGKSERLRRTHGDFHPFNVLFDDRSQLSVLDASRGTLGDPADDVACLTLNHAFFSFGHPGAWRGALGPLWDAFWDAYLAATNDEALFEVIAPLFAWRGLVLASPTWYPELTADDRECILSFVETALAAERFSPELASTFFDT